MKKLEKGILQNKDAFESLLNDTVANGRTFSGNYEGQNIKRLKLTNCIFDNANFNDAAVTGSCFHNCIFQQCKMDQGDFEFCDFYNCHIKSKMPISIAFDNSNFIETQIQDLEFYSSTFSNSFFEEAKLENVVISDCTLEAATFQHCSFINVDFSHLNLDFVDFQSPYFENAILPMSQIVYTYGLLQYLMDTDDNVYISENDKKLTPDQYVKEFLPAIMESYLTTKDAQKEKIYFPLINILLALDQIEEANGYLEKALNLSASIQDFRMMKHYCKLISRSEYYSSKKKRSIYQRICGYFHPNSMTPWQLKDYSRNIGDIKYILLIENNFPTLIFNILTDIYHSSINKLSMFIDDIFHASDKYAGSSQKDIRIELSRNSPIMISVQFTESAENVLLMLSHLIALTCYTVYQGHIQQKNSSPFKGYMIGEQCLDFDMKERLLQYKNNQLSLTLLSFHVENWRKEYGQQYPLPINYVNSDISIVERG